MKLKEALEILNKEKFSLDYNYNNRNWTLTIFDKELEIIKEIKGLFLKNVLKSHLGIELEKFKEFYEIENHYTEIVFNYSNIDDTENFYLINYTDEDYYGENNKIKTFKDFVKTLRNMDDIVDIDRLNFLSALEEERDPYGSRGLTYSDFLYGA